MLLPNDFLSTFLRGGSKRRVLGTRLWSRGEGIFHIGRPLLKTGFQRRKMSFVHRMFSKLA